MSTPERATPGRPARLPPRWFIRAAWVIHRAIYRRDRRATRAAAAGRRQWGTMRLTTVGRRSGEERHAILGYFEDGPNLVTMAMNGWGEPEPAWWLNLQAQPDATVELTDGTRAVRGRAATPEERPRLWARWAEYDGDDARRLRRPPPPRDGGRHPRAPHPDARLRLIGHASPPASAVSVT